MTDHKTGTRAEWLAARLELLEAEKTHIRRSGELARLRQALPWVRVDKEVPLPDRRRHSVARGPFQRTFAAARLSFHVRPRLQRRLPILLGDRRRLQRLRRAPRESRRLVLRRVASPARNCRLTRSGWAGVSRGHRRSRAISTPISRRRTPKEEWRSGAVEYNFRTTDLRPATPEASIATHSQRASRHELGDVQAGGARHERVRAQGRRRLPNLLGILARTRRPLGHVPVLDRAHSAATRKGGSGGGVTTNTTDGDVGLSQRFGVVVEPRA